MSDTTIRDDVKALLTKLKPDGNGEVSINVEELKALVKSLEGKITQLELSVRRERVRADTHFKAYEELVRDYLNLKRNGGCNHV